MSTSQQLSVCIPAYRRSEYLRLLVSGLPADFPIFISDNGGFITAEKLSWTPNVTLAPCENVLSMFRNWNRAISLCDTEWFILPGDDDIVFSDRLPLVRELIGKYPDAGCLIFGYENIDSQGNVLSEWHPQERKVYRNPEGFREFRYGVLARWPAIVFRTEAVKAIGGFDTDFTNTASDSLLMQNMALHFPIVFVPEILGQYRIWENSGTSKLICEREWFDNIELWMNKLGRLLNTGNDASPAEDIRTIASVVTTDNLSVALNNLRTRNVSLKDRLYFLRNMPKAFPLKTRDKLRLTKALLPSSFATRLHWPLNTSGKL